MGDRSTQKMPPKKKDDKKGATGSKKTMKDFLAKTKAGASAKKKKWSKGKVREKLNNAVTFDQPTYDKMMKEAAMFKLVTPSVISDPPQGQRIPCKTGNHRALECRQHPLHRQ